jgi:hypothetical protein
VTFNACMGPALVAERGLARAQNFAKPYCGTASSAAPWTDSCPPQAVSQGHGRLDSISGWHGTPTTTRFPRARRSDIVHPATSSQLAEARDQFPVVPGATTSRPVRNQGSDADDRVLDALRELVPDRLAHPRAQLADCEPRRGRARPLVTNSDI